MRALPDRRLGRAVVRVLAAAGVIGTLIAVPSAGALTLSARAGSPAAPLTLTARAASAPNPQGLTPGQMRAAYGLPVRGASGQTVAIISAWDDPAAQTDLNAYDQHFALPPCTNHAGCFRKLNQNGKPGPLPGGDPTGGTWVTESGLGTEVAHAVCQSCSILLVEASSDSKADFSKAVDAAAGAGATVIVTTFTPTEDVGDAQYASDYSQARATVVAAAGDALVGNYGYTGGLNFPSALPNVLAVGGTQLRVPSGGGHWGEQAWSGTVSGCSLYQRAASWQLRLQPSSHCAAMRPVADLSAVAVPGAIVHITGVGPAGPWYVAQGTSFSAPMIGAVIGLAGSVGGGEAQMLYARQQSDPGAFHDIIAGANAPGCAAPICHAGKGWDGPTGLGSPAGLEAFLPRGPALSLRRPQLTISAPHGQLQSNRRWGVAITLRNGNAFRVSGSVAVRRSLRVGGRLRTVVFAVGSTQLGPLAQVTARLTIDSRYRSLLRRLGRITVYVQLGAHGAVGPTASVSAALSLRAP